MGMTLQPNKTSMDLWCDTDFCGNQDPEMAIVDRATTKSRTGYIVILRYAL